MTMERNSHYEVVVVGFGPSGAVAAGLLGQRGRKVLCVDRAREVYDKPRAIAVDHEIMRVFQGLGVVERIAEHVAVFPPSEYYGVDGQLIKRIDTVPKPWPLGYMPTMVFTQPPVEAALREHASAYDTVEIALGVELVRFEETAQGVTVHLKDDTNATRTVTCDYLLGCDGASSTVRTQLGIEYEDLVFDEPWLVVDMRVNERGIEKLPKVAIQYCEPSRPCTYIVGPGGHRRWEIMLMPGENPREMQQEEQVWTLLSRWLDREDGELWRAASYRFHALVAKEWRRGRVFIGGDAAHQQPPFIGQGMCQGIRDVVNLVWKLDAVMAGAARSELLDSYQAERSLHVRQLTTRIKEIGKLICERSVDAARERDARLLREAGGVVKTIARQDIVPKLDAGLLSQTSHAANGTLFPQPRVRYADDEALLDLVAGGDWRLVTLDGELLSGDALNAASRIGAQIVELTREGDAYHESMPSDTRRIVEIDGVLAAWFERNLCRAAIVRPDHYVYGVAGDAADLVELLAKLDVALHG
ncbi:MULTISPECIES: bifunctional 3-(3-hydroxy-phenyl)propionate/3-hydroxycinnamic acid hydroxylase [Burkholderia]|uniref:bifunctional 3-(3-hydroxy-phenyl)propionate/3-hydroxycinnamic acid hydroxylase n=1 Tax=Burkholderia TaxID=32008 RepID=UPI000BBD24F7|nr:MULTISPECIES: bifunctional 3-(3-hydroxy-phenyl)propionate/3-hydroxycinnamic acid hydroxylase [Burkholderia]ATF90014.1 FAD-binding monooxygenase [Burkholderia gladioli pv. gladioli]MBJ9712941.1 bifunctional 3-(3-hydroxy-phenyl)propionate/3-hydroxycinnamic acid hydroxylase [Burkholderia gladioli]MBU9153539.1 bifunctional 3-(3-hydroxy-phenyl)propionate/3-hydroxycinnamic acid hydroxylase [Burkholderia gladioli]MBU9171218.1 bifunctional 3-(3-hydroxy-phenyl)propionate/3-hydroxycinnamic acid hydrox